MPANIDDIERNTLPVIYNVNPSTVIYIYIIPISVT